MYGTVIILMTISHDIACARLHYRNSET